MTPWPPRSVVAVCAHPDDESFGMGALLAALSLAGTSVGVVTFTAGEASTLGAALGPLAEVRSLEMAEAAEVLGVRQTVLLDYPDGRLDETPLEKLSGHVVSLADDMAAEALLAFDLGGVTGHPDHQRATEAALAAARELAIPVLGWAVRSDVAAALNTEFLTTFVGREPEEVDMNLTVDRELQLRAIACHRSQSGDNPVLWRRLEATGEVEPLRWLHRPSAQLSA